MVSQNDVAKRAGVSNAVVSYVVNNGPRKTSKETRQKVLNAIKELGYRKNNIASSLKTRTSKVIGLIIPDSSNAFFSEVAKGIEDEVYQQGYTLMIGNSSSSIHRQEKYIETFISQMVDGLIFLTTPLPEEHQTIMMMFATPAVIIDPEFLDEGKELKEIYVVAVNNKKGGALAAEHLINRGHQKLAVIAGAEEVPPGNLRVAGFRDEALRNGLNTQVIWAGDHPEDGYSAAMFLLNSTDPPTAVFACNDLLALGIMRAAWDLGIKIPDELAVVGFDDIDMAKYTHPRLTTVRQPKFEMGQIAAKFLINKINKGSQKKGNTENSIDEPTSIFLDTELIVRESA